MSAYFPPVLFQSTYTASLHEGIPPRSKAWLIRSNLFAVRLECGYELFRGSNCSWFHGVREWCIHAGTTGTRVPCTADISVHRRPPRIATELYSQCNHNYYIQNSQTMRFAGFWTTLTVFRGIIICALNYFRPQISVSRVTIKLPLKIRARYSTPTFPHFCFVTFFPNSNSFLNACKDSDKSYYPTWPDTILQRERADARRELKCETILPRRYLFYRRTNGAGYLIASESRAIADRFSTPVQRSSNIPKARAVTSPLHWNISMWVLLWHIGTKTHLVRSWIEIRPDLVSVWVLCP